MTFKPEWLTGTANTGPVAKSTKPVAPDNGDKEEMDPDAPKAVTPTTPKTATGDPDDPEPGETKPAPAKGDTTPLPTVPDNLIPPDEKPAPEKKTDPKKTVPPPELPKLGPPPLTFPKIDDPDDPKPAPEKSVFEYVPGDAISFSVVRVGAFLDSPSGAKVIELAGPGYAAFTKDLQDKLKLDPKEIRIVVAAFVTVPTDPKKLQDNAIMLVETAKPIDVTPITKDADAKFEIAGKEAFSKKDMPVILVLVSPTQIDGRPEEGRGGNRGQAAEAGPAERLAQGGGGEQGARLSSRFQVTTISELAGIVNMGLDPIRKSMPGVPAIADAVGGQLTISEDKALKLSLKLTYADADHAEKSKKAVEELVEQGSAVLTLSKAKIDQLPQGAKLGSLGKSALASVKPAVEGETLTVPLQIDATIGDLAIMGMSMMPPMGGPPPGPPPAPKQIEKEKE